MRILRSFRENGGGFFDISPENYQNNIEEAKRLMAEAGYPNGKNFPVFEFKADLDFIYLYLKPFSKCGKKI